MKSSLCQVDNFSRWHNTSNGQLITLRTFFSHGSCFSARAMKHRVISKLKDLALYIVINSPTTKKKDFKVYK